jgi:hypothetical protein
LRTYLGRTICDNGRKIAGQAGLKKIFAQPPRLARRVREQRQRQRYMLSTHHQRFAFARLSAP